MTTSRRRRLDSSCLDTVTIPDLIARKRDGLALSEEEISLFVNSLGDKSIQESQIDYCLKLGEHEKEKQKRRT
ncbi:hypothetical protein ACF0H5_007607 [Mactra antiquata]